MRNLATCYSEHAVRVSDSYCSGPLNLSCVSPSTMMMIPSIQNAVSFTYKTKISPQKHLFITITWCSKLICQGFWIKISDKMPSSFIRNCPNSLLLSKTKGTKRFEACGLEVELHWDLSNANFDSGPVPMSSFYIVVLIDSNVGLIMGDMEDEHVVRKVIVGLPIAKHLLVSQCEHFSGNKQQYPTKARFCDSGLAHNIMVRFDEEDEGANHHRILSVFVDNKRVIKIRRLQWNFRGNQTVFIDGVLVDVMWDVHGWFFDHGNAVFMLRTRSGLDDRLWFEENNLAEMNHDQAEFSLVICASKNTG